MTLGESGSAITTEADLDALRRLPLVDLEEASGELHRRIGIAFRALGERRADQPDEAAEAGSAAAGGDAGRGGRWRVASLAATLELSAATLAAVAATRGELADALPRTDQHPSHLAAIMYAAPTIGALLQRLEQNRRLVASLARTLESRLDETHATPWGRQTIRALVTDAAIAAPARCAMALERHAQRVLARDA